MELTNSKTHRLNKWPESQRSKVPGTKESKEEAPNRRSSSLVRIEDTSEGPFFTKWLTHPPKEEVRETPESKLEKRNRFAS